MADARFHLRNPRTTTLSGGIVCVRVGQVVPCAARYRMDQSSLPTGYGRWPFIKLAYRSLIADNIIANLVDAFQKVILINIYATNLS